MREWTKFAMLVTVFLLLYTVPFSGLSLTPTLDGGLSLLQEYARLHVLTCLVPAFFIAGTISVYVKKDAIIRLMGPRSRLTIAYPVASISGGLLATCSCTILPLFTGVYKRGAGIGPAVAFLFTGPAINITALVLTGGVLGWDFAIGRLLAAITISVIAGLIMSRVFRDHERQQPAAAFATGMSDNLPYSNRTIAVFVGLQLLVLILFELSMPAIVKASLVIGSVVVLTTMVVRVLRPEHNLAWVHETWELTKKILPLLFVGVFIAGIIETVVPARFISDLVGENSLSANTFASTFGAFMYFATLTEVPIIQKLMALGMGRGPALTLMLTGNALSLPSMFVLFKVMGRKQAAAYIVLVVVVSIFAGFVFGAIVDR